MTAVTYELQQSIAVITLNQPESMNSLSKDLWSEWVAAIERANDDPSVSAMIFTGNGPAFCAGGDMHDGFLPKLRGEEPYDPDDHRLGGLDLD